VRNWSRIITGYFAGKSYDGKRIQILIGDEGYNYHHAQATGFDRFRITLNHLPTNQTAQATYYVVDATDTLTPHDGGTQTVSATGTLTLERALRLPRYASCAYRSQRISRDHESLEPMAVLNLILLAGQ